MILHEQHRSLVAYAASVMRSQFPGKSAEEYKRAESRLATSVRRRIRGNKAIWTLTVPELNLQLERTESLVVCKCGAQISISESKCKPCLDKEAEIREWSEAR